MYVANVFLSCSKINSKTHSNHKYVYSKLNAGYKSATVGMLINTTKSQK
jgi:hypothetical protein